MSLSLDTVYYVALHYESSIVALAMLPFLR